MFATQVSFIPTREWSEKPTATFVCNHADKLAAFIFDQVVDPRLLQFWSDIGRPGVKGIPKSYLFEAGQLVRHVQRALRHALLSRGVNFEDLQSFEIGTASQSFREVFLEQEGVRCE